jgi:hypothetical protein
MENDPNPVLCLGPKNVLNHPGPTNPYGPGWPCTKLTDAPPTWAPPNNNNPDPPTVDP